MAEFRARISRVRMKAGGADVRVLRQEPANGDEDWRGTILANAKRIADASEESAPLVGYLIVGLFGDGSTSTGFRCDHARCSIPRALWPAWMEEVVRREVVTEPRARAVFDDMFEWQDK